MNQKKTPIVGQVINEEKENLESIQEKQVNRKIQIMDDLDKIQAPIMCTVIVDPQAFEYRNAAFWQAFQKKDKEVRNLLQEYLDTKGKKS